MASVREDEGPQTGTGDDAVTVRWLVHAHDDPALAARWDALATDAVEPNPFAERWCLAPAFDCFPDPARRLLLVEHGAVLVGVLPLTIGWRYGRLAAAHVTNWRHSNSFFGAPLVRAGMATAFWHAVLDAVEGASWARGWLHLAELDADGPLLAALSQVAAARGRRCDIVHETVRAVLRSTLSAEEYWQQAVRGKKRKELRRQAARLGDDGRVEWAEWQPGEPVGPWIEAFLALEAAGWKGAAGSALASDAATRAWACAAMTGAADAGQLQVRSLTLDGRAIAMLVQFIGPGGGYSFKTAFDEGLSRFSPGVLLQQANLDWLDRRPGYWIDSCAAADHPMIDSIWRERRRVVRVTLPLAGWRGRAMFGAVRAAERGFGRLRRRSPTPPPATSKGPPA